MTMKLSRIGSHRFGCSDGLPIAAWVCLIVVAACGGEADPSAADTGNRSGIAQAPSPSRTALANTPTPGVVYAQGRLSVQADKASLRVVANAIARQAGIAVALDPRLVSRSIDGRFSDVPLVDGLLQLLRDYDLVLSFSAAGRSATALAAVWVYPKGLGPRGALAETAALATMKAAAGEANAVRREVLLHAETPHPVPAEETAPRAAAPPIDPESRVLALGALTRDPALDAVAVRATVQIALQDNDPTVREQARYLLEQLDQSASNEGLAAPP